MKKKLFAIVMSATMVMSFMPSLAFATVDPADRLDHEHTWSKTLQTINVDKDGKVIAGDVSSRCDYTIYKAYTCACGAYKGAVLVGEAQHSYKKTKKSNCVETWDQYECTKCHDIYKENIKSTGKNHKLTPARVQVTAPTCTENEVRAYECTSCHEYIDPIEVPDSKLGHKFDKPKTKADGTKDYSNATSKVEPTCMKEGKYVYECKNGCGKTEEYSIEKAKHDYTVLAVVKEATCSSPQISAYCCSTVGCPAYKSAFESAPASAHTYKTEVTPAKCEKDGLEVKTCTACGAKEEKVIPATGHKFGVVKEQVSEATCTEDEVLAYKCMNGCGTYSDPVAGDKALGHNKDVKTWSFVAPTCTEKAYKVKYCGRVANGETCKEVVEVAELDLVKDAALIGDKKVEPTGHVMELKSIENATCAKEGVKTYKCKFCDETQTETIAKLPHTEVVETVDATCTKAGVKTTKCSVCDEVIDTVEIPALGHDFVKTDDVVEPTCTEAGHQGYKCSACGETKVEELAAPGHNVVEDAAVVETATKTGLTAGSHCSVCNEVIEAQTVTVAKAKTPSVKAGKKSLTATAAKVTGATKYQVAYKRSGSKYTWKYAKASTKNAQTIKNLVKGKKYYVKVRTISGDVVGAWSSTKAVKVK